MVETERDDTARELVDATLEELLARVDPRSTDPKEFFGAQFDAGLANVAFPVGHGGLGLPAPLQRRVDERLRAAGAKSPVMRNPLGVGMGLPLLISHGTAAQQERFLRPCFTGAEIWCQLFSEPGAGSDVASLSTRAVRQPDGGWRVDGQKVWSSLAHKASVGMLLARCDPNRPKHEGLVVLLLDMRAPGVTVRPLREITGEAVFNEVFFAGVDVPDDRRIGEPGEGWQVARTILTAERVMLSGAGAGTGPDVVGGSRIEKLVERARANGTWDDALVRDELVRRFVEGQVIRQTNIRSRQRRTRGLPTLHGAITKLSQGLYNRRLQATALRVSGPAANAWRTGDADGAGTAQGYLRAQANTIEGGTPEMLRNTIGERLLGLPRDEGPARDTPWSQLRKN